MTGKDLRELREKYSLSKSQIAKFLGVHVTTITNWESRPSKVISRRYLGQLELLRGKIGELKASAGASYSDAAVGVLLAGMVGVLATGLIGGLIGSILNDRKKS